MGLSMMSLVLVRASVRITFCDMLDEKTKVKERRFALLRIRKENCPFLQLPEKHSEREKKKKRDLVVKAGSSIIKKRLIKIQVTVLRSFPSFSSLLPFACG